MHPAGYFFDEAEAARRCSFFEKCLVHGKGEWKGSALRLDPWQREQIIGPLFGWKRRDGMRRYRSAYFEIPRKNGKSTLCGGIALSLLGEGEPGAEIYSAAADKDQARIVFHAAKEMVEASPVLTQKLSVFKDVIERKDGNGFYKALSSEAYTKHGLNPSGVVVDELHTQPDDELVGVLRSAMGARRQPLFVQITTAGYDRHSVCWREHEYGRKVISGEVVDDSHLAVIYAAPQDADWKSPEVWAAANPGYGVSVKPDFLALECAKAQNDPAYENVFRRLYLNQWTEARSRWIAMDRWDECGLHFEEADLVGKDCWGGLDLSSKLDITAFVLSFKSGELLCRFWIPEEGIEAKEKRDGVPYGLWVRQGYLRTTKGDSIDYDEIEAQVRQDVKVFKVRQIAYDPWNAESSAQHLSKAGIEMFPMRQGFASLSEPTKNFSVDVLKRSMKHAGNPVLRWMIGNVSIDTDAAGNQKPSKEKSKEKIDGAVAAIMARDRMSRGGGGKKRSIYETRGLVGV